MHFGKVYIVVLNWNGWKDTVDCLNSIVDLDYPDYSIIIIDNGSTDDSVTHVISWLENKWQFTFFVQTASPDCGSFQYFMGQRQDYQRKVFLVPLESNLGFAGGNNVAIRFAETLGDYGYIYFLNNDTHVDRCALQYAVATANRFLKVGFVGSKLLYHYSPQLLQGLGVEKFNPYIGYARLLGADQEDGIAWTEDRPILSFIGAAFLAKREAIIDVGNMDESFFLYREETEWSFRAREKGWEIWSSAKSRVYHKVNRSLGPSSPEIDYYSTINTMRLIRKYYPFRCIMVVAIVQLGRIPLRLIQGRFSNVAEIIKAFVDFAIGRTPKERFAMQKFTRRRVTGPT